MLFPTGFFNATVYGFYNTKFLSSPFHVLLSFYFGLLFYFPGPGRVEGDRSSFKKGSAMADGDDHNRPKQHIWRRLGPRCVFF